MGYLEIADDNGCWGRSLKGTIVDERNSTIMKSVVHASEVPVSTYVPCSIPPALDSTIMQSLIEVILNLFVGLYF